MSASADAEAAANPASAPPAQAAMSPSTHSEHDGLEGRAGESGRAGARGGRQSDAGARGRAARSDVAHLLGAANPCGDLFPYAARSDSGSVAVAIDVASSGQALGSYIVEEAPRDQGFALAARHCVRRLRFSPARDTSGQSVASRSLVRLRFDRARVSL